MGCCLFASILAGAPRLAFILMWLFRPIQTQQAFDSFFLALIGWIFLPWTTLAYVFVIPNEVNGFDWIVLGGAILIDIGTYTGGGMGQKRRMSS